METIIWKLLYYIGVIWGEWKMNGNGNVSTVDNERVAIEAILRVLKGL